MFETGAKSVVEKILPVVDNFERGLAALSEEEMKQPFLLMIFSSYLSMKSY